MTVRTAAALLLGLLGITAACGTTARVGDTPRSVPAAPGAATAGHAPAAVGRYGVEPAASLSPLEREATEAVQERIGRGGGAPRASSALVLAARRLAEDAAAGAPEPLAPARVRRALTSALAFDPAPVAHLVSAEANVAPRALARAVAPSTTGTHLGVGAAVSGSRAYLVLLVTERRARLDPFPREVAQGERSVLAGEVIGLTSPTVHMTSPAGESRTIPAAGTRGNRFSAAIAFDAPGRYRVEVVATGPRGPEVAALLTVACGSDHVTGDAPQDGPDPADDREAEARVVAALNATRQRQQLPPLEPWTALAEVARRHSQAMLEAGVLAHRLPGSEGPGERLRRARVPFALVLENVAKGPGSLAAHRLAEDSPAHRQNILSPDVTRVGCGIARGRLPTGEQIVYLTELFVHPVEDGTNDRMTPEARVKEAIWHERARLGAAPLTSDLALDELARAAARRMLAAGEPSPADLADRALALRRNLAAADGFVASRASEATRSRNLADPRLRRVGVGVAVGDSARHGPGLLWIAVVYTD